jgi:hypothetical protein
MSKTGGTPKRARAPDAELALRVEDVLHCRLNGGEFYDVRAFAKEKGWDVSDRQLWRYIGAADRLLEQSLERDRDKLFRRHLAQRRALYARALNDGDLRTALAIARDEAELHGLYPGKKVQLSGSKDEPLTLNVEALTDAERAAAVQRIVARYGLPGGGPAGALADRDGAGDGHRPLLG